MATYIIQDWASNTLQFTGKFNFGCYGNDLGVPMTFKSFDDADEYLCEKLGEEGYFMHCEDYEIVALETERN